jgi:hypothetical protein
MDNSDSQPMKSEGFFCDNFSNKSVIYQITSAQPKASLATRWLGGQAASGQNS